MRLSSLRLSGFRCFDLPGTTITFDDLTTFVGINGAGKSAVLMALARMFGTSNALRTLRKEDFHVPPGEANPTLLKLELDARFELPELLRDDTALESTAIPECLKHIVLSETEETPQCRIRLTATWTQTASPEGDIDQKLEWVNSLDDEPPEETLNKLHAVERSLIQVHYIPAARDATRELRATSGTILTRALQHVAWSQQVTDTLLDLDSKTGEALRSEAAFAELEATLQDNWEKLRTDENAGKPELAVTSTELAALLRRIDARISLTEATTQPVALLSEGERSLLYFALIASALEFEASHLSDPNLPTDNPLPVLTIVAVEEPENHLAPHYLSRILQTLRRIQAQRGAQVVITSHSASILRRVDPTEVRHFRIDPDGKRIVTRLTLPASVDEAFKYVREAVRAHPELYFARAVVLAEGPSEEVVLPRLAQALGVDIDPRFVTVVPMGGRHVRHFWRLLSEIGTPHVTLLDLDAGRAHGGWARVYDLLQELIENGTPPEEVRPGMTDEHFNRMRSWKTDQDDPGIDDWIQYLEQANVFLSRPLDLDLLLLQAFADQYKGLGPPAGGPRPIPSDAGQRASRLKSLTQVVLGDEGDAAPYTETQRELFAWYSYLFIQGSKPTAHYRVFAQLADDEIQKRCPDVLHRLVKRVQSLVTG